MLPYLSEKVPLLPNPSETFWEDAEILSRLSSSPLPLQSGINFDFSTGDTTLGSVEPEGPMAAFFALAQLHGFGRAEALALLWMSSDQTAVAAHVLRRRENPARFLWTPGDDERLTSGDPKQVASVWSKFGAESIAFRLRFLERMTEPAGGLQSLAFADV